MRPFMAASLPMARALPIAMLVVLGLSWAIRLLAIRTAAVGGVSPIDVAMVATAGIVLLLTLLSVARSKYPRLSRHHLRFYAATGLFGFAAPFLAEIIVAPHLSVLHFVIVVTSAPVWTVFISIVFRLEAVDWRRVAGIVTGFMATALVIFGTQDGNQAVEFQVQPIWIAAAFSIPILYAIYVLYIAAVWPKDVDNLQGAHGQAIVALVTYFCFWLVFSEKNGDAQTLATQWAIWVIVLSEVIALLLLFSIARTRGGSFASQANYVAVVAGAVIGVTYFNQPVNWLTLAGVILLIFALWLSSRKWAKAVA